MGAGRRGFLRAAAGVAGIGTVASVGAAQSGITVRGTVRAAGVDLSGGTVRLANADNRQQAAVATLGSDGTFETPIPGPGAYVATFYDGTRRRVTAEENGRPVLAGLGRVSVKDDTDTVGTLSLPTAYAVPVRFLTGDGHPIEYLPVNFRAANGAGLAPGQFTTTANGLVLHAGAADPGIELGGEIRVAVHPKDGEPVEVGQLSVTERREYAVTVPNPDRFSEARVRPGELNGGTGAGNGRKAPVERGFFTNSGTDPEYLTNPLNLTTLGFLLSVAGIAHQLIGGRDG